MIVSLVIMHADVQISLATKRSPINLLRSVERPPDAETVDLALLNDLELSVW